MSPDTSLVQQNEPVAVTKLRNIRVDDALWLEAQKIAAENRETLSAVLKRALVDYVKSNGGSVAR